MTHWSFAIALLLFSSIFTSPYNTNIHLAQEEPIKIVFDRSHGQDLGSDRIEVDHLLEYNLTELGYEIVWATGGLNSSILGDADGLVIGPLYGQYSGFLPEEIVAITDWFAPGNKLLWVGCKADYEGEGLGQFINDNMSLILEAVGSHVYPESVEIDDYESNCGEPYRTVGNETNSDPFVANIVSGVTKVLMHGTCSLYGSNNVNPGRYIDVVPLESIEIENVYPLLYSSAASVITNYEESIPGEVHGDMEIGSFALCTLEIFAGPSERGVILVSGAAPYGNYRPCMYYHAYCGYSLDGYMLVTKAIDVGIQMALSFTSSTTRSTSTGTATPPPPIDVPLYAMIATLAIGVAAVAIGIALRRMK